jgi:hypothetical protein
VDDELERLIVKFKIPEPSDGPPKAFVIKREDRLKDCQHPQRQLDPKLRTISCGKCGALLDPIECLMDLAKYEESLCWRLEEIKRHKKREAEREAAAMETAKRRKFRKALREASGEPKHPNVLVKLGTDQGNPKYAIVLACRAAEDAGLDSQTVDAFRKDAINHSWDYAEVVKVCLKWFSVS